MKRIFTVFLIWTCLEICKAAPVSAVTVPESNDIPEEMILEDDSTTHNLERLVSAATCLVAGVEYTHGQQIYRADQCEFCLCLDGEMFCWWDDDCPQIVDSPCKDRRPFSPCDNSLENHLEHPNTPVKLSTILTTFPSPQTHKIPTEMVSTSTESNLEDTWSTSDNSTTDDTTEMSSVEETTQDEKPSSSEANVCVVMGTSYKIGEMLPHATGNCLECICGPGARVTCSPHLCAPPGDDAIDYRPPGPF